MTRGGYRMVRIDWGYDDEITRHRVYDIDGEPHVIVHWTDSCSGCTPGYDEIGYVPKQGGGCFECGYTGKRRSGAVFPIKPHSGNAGLYEIDAKKMQTIIAGSPHGKAKL